MVIPPHRAAFWLLAVTFVISSPVALAQPDKLTVSKGAVSTAYFTALPFRETPFADLKGIHPITRDQARAKNHFRFEYDGEGRLIRVTFLLGDIPRPLNDHTDNFFFQTPRVDIAYEDGRETRRFFDEHGNPAGMRGVFREVYELDDLGYRKRLTFYNSAGERIENDWGIAEYVWTIQKNGLVIEDHFNLAGEVVPKRPNLPFMRLRLHYGPSGWLALMENYGTENRLVNNAMNAAQDKLEYEADGDMRVWNVYDENEQRVKGNSPGVARGIREFDSNGYVVRSYYEDENGERMRSAYGWGETENQYDSYGNLVARWSGDEFGGPGVNEQLDYHGYRLSWDRTGRNNTEIRFYGVDKKTPAIHKRMGAHGFNMAYDGNGNRTSVSYFDASDNPVARRDYGAAVIEYSYDKKARLIETRRLGLDGALSDNNRQAWAVERVSYDDAGMESGRQHFYADMTPFE